MSLALELSGRRFGKMLVKSRVGKDEQGYTTWLCLCDCGTFKDVRGCNLTNGSVMSCGCSRRANKDIYQAPRMVEEERLQCDNFPSGMKRRLEALSKARGTTVADTVRFAMMDFIERTERQQFFLDRTEPVMYEKEEDEEVVK
jgi:predicted DNA-binding protein